MSREPQTVYTPLQTVETAAPPLGPASERPKVQSRPPRPERTAVVSTVGIRLPKFGSRRISSSCRRSPEARQTAGAMQEQKLRARKVIRASSRCSSGMSVFAPMRLPRLPTAQSSPARAPAATAELLPASAALGCARLCALPKPGAPAAWPPKGACRELAWTLRPSSCSLSASADGLQKTPRPESMRGTPRQITATPNHCTALVASPKAAVMSTGVAAVKTPFCTTAARALLEVLPARARAHMPTRLPMPLRTPAATTRGSLRR
mmetsp:Transcript_55786/g.179039  ORF Transcript_55786/g.179039 Transcript_55786/m.179039 type:complete len:264 (+) Transcript_55786:107-898(+)